MSMTTMCRLVMTPLLVAAAVQSAAWAASPAADPAQRAAGAVQAATDPAQRAAGTVQAAPQVAARDSADAVQAAEAWLDHVDAGRYEESLATAAPLLRSMAGSVDQWRQFVTMARVRYSVSGQRNVVLWEPDYAAEGAPSGRYARLVFTADGTAQEVVVLVQTTAGWRVAMYAVGPRA